MIGIFQRRDEPCSTEGQLAPRCANANDPEQRARPWPVKLRVSARKAKINLEAERALFIREWNRCFFRIPRRFVRAH